MFVIPTLAGARLDVPTLAVQLKPAGLTDNMEVATGAALVTPEPYTDVQAPAEYYPSRPSGRQGSQVLSTSIRQSIHQRSPSAPELYEATWLNNRQESEAS